MVEALEPENAGLERLSTEPSRKRIASCPRKSHHVPWKINTLTECVMTKRNTLILSILGSIFLLAGCITDTQPFPDGSKPLLDRWTACVFTDFFETNGGETVIPNDALDASFDRCSDHEMAFSTFVYNESFKGKDGIRTKQRKATAELAVKEGKKIIRQGVFRVIGAAQ